MEELLNEIKLFTMFAGTALATGEILSIYFKAKAQKAKDKLANGHLINKDDILSILGEDGLTLSKDIQLKEKYDFEGSATFGATGSGKSTGIFIPNLLNNKIKGSLVVTDIKEELFTLTSGYQQEVCGRKVLKFSPLDPLKTEKYNLLTACKSNVEVNQLAQSLIFNGSLSTELITGKKTGGVEWTQMAGAYMAAGLHYVKALGFPYDNIEFAFQLLISLNFDQLDKLFSESKNYDCITQWNIIRSGKRADRTVDSIRITFATNMQIFVDERINASSMESTFDFETFRKEPTILYITYPVDQAKYISPFTAPLFDRMLNTFVRVYKEHESLPVTILADEFANIGMLSSMNTLCSVIRSSEVSMNICLQGLTQLYQLYGKDNAISILNNLKTKMILPSMSDELALNYISDLCDNKEIEVVTKTDTKSGTTTNHSQTSIRMFSRGDLRCLEDDQILIITGNKQPILSYQNTYYKNSEYIHNIKDPVKISKNSMEKHDFKDYIQELKKKLVIEKENSYDIREELFK
jgi:type IV secretion system protein VirD4